jgi:rifampicin phosphotransferase
VAMARWVVSLRDPGAADLREAGGKAAGLARLASLGLPVPPAFAVVASFFEEVRSLSPNDPEIESLPARTPPAMREEVDSALEALGDAPHGYAVRSSTAEEDRAGISFAGVHESFLRLRREDVPAALFRCWASGLSDRAIAYRRRMGLSTEFSAIRMGVVTQVMLRPAVSGVLFTREPGGAGNFLLIEAAEGAAGGESAPISVRFPRGAAGSGGAAPPGLPLPDPALRRLLDCALRAEAAWGSPLDLEWALEGDRIFLLQARPITRGTEAPAGAPDSAAGFLPGEDCLWSRANLRELLPELPSVFFSSLLERVDWQAMHRRAGLKPPRGAMVRVIQGRPYFNLTLIGSMLESLGLSASRFARALGHGSDVLGLPEREDHPLRALLRHPILNFRVQRRQARIPRKALEFFDRAHALSRRLREEDPARLSDAGLRERLLEMESYNREFLALLMGGFHRVSSKMFAVEALHPGGEGLEAFVNAVAGAGRRNVSLRQGLDLLHLARRSREEGRVLQYLVEGTDGYRNYELELRGTAFEGAFREYLEEYGHRGLRETDPSMPVYREDPAYLLKAVSVAAADPLCPDPEALERRRRDAAAAAWRHLRRSVRPVERWLPLRRLLLRKAVRALREAMALREQIRFEGMRPNAEFREFLREAERRLCQRGLLDAPGDLFLLRMEEVEGALSGRQEGERLPERVLRRRDERKRQEEIAMPNFLRESEIPHLSGRGSMRFLEEGTFRGLPVGPGRVEGRAVVLEGPHQIDRVRRGDILVAPTLDPSWIPLFTIASGLVVEMGGTLSHGSIIAREYGLPAVVNLPGITRLLQSGDRILLDGSAGLVRRLSR